MSDIYYRSVKGQPLSNEEVDHNFEHLDETKYGSNDDAEFKSLAVTELSSLDGGIDVNGDFVVDGAGNITGTALTVSGLASLDGGINVNDKFTVNSASGNIAGATLTATGLASLDGGINVNDTFVVNTFGSITSPGLASLDGGINVNDDFTVDSNGNITGVSANITGPSGIKTRYNTTGDGVEIVGRNGGNDGFKVTLTPTTLTASRTVTLANGNTTFQEGTMAVTGTGLGQFAATTSAQLASVISDETGTDKLVFSTNPTLTTPKLTGAVVGAGVTTLSSANNTSNNYEVIFPAAGGTLLTTDAVGLVSSSMIADGTIVNNDISAVAGIVDTKLNTISTTGKVLNSATTATSANTASAIVARDGSGNFSAGTITANLLGNALTATSATTLTGTAAVANGGTGQTSYTDGQLLIGNSAGNTLTKATLTAGTGINITNGSGAVTIATSTDTTNASNITSGTLALARGGIGSSLADPNADRILFWDDSAGSTTWLTVGSGLSISGTTITATAGGGGSVTSVGMTVPTGLSVAGSPVTSSGTLAVSLTAGYAIPTTASQTNWTTAYGWGNHATAGYATAGSTNLGQFAATTSAQLASVISDETGTGALVFANSPTLVSPNLGTPTSINLSNATGLSLTTGVTGTLPVAKGGTGVTVSSGTGSVVLNTGPTFITPAIKGSSTGATTLASANGSVTNYTITLPAVNGTVITTGDTGTVTSSMIADGTIINTDISAVAGITDTKLTTISTPGKVSNSATTATSTNTTGAIVARDGSGNFSAGTITASLSGNATTSTAWQTGRTISLTGAVTGTSGTFNGSGNLSFATSIADESITMNKLDGGTSTTQTANGSTATIGILSTDAISATTGGFISKITSGNAVGGAFASTVADGLLGATTAGNGKYGVVGYGGATTSAFTDWTHVGALGYDGTSYGMGGYFYNGNSSITTVLCGDRANVFGLYTSQSILADGYVYATNVAPFTGSHLGMLLKNTSIVPGDILVDTDIITIQNVSNSITKVALSNNANQKGTIGIFCEYTDSNNPPRILCNLVAGNDHIPIATVKPEYQSLFTTHNVISINSLGEGAINVTGENGNIEIGDLIVTSSTPGKGMKQSDDIVRSITVAKSRQNVTFSDPSEVKQISCIFLAG